MIKRAQQFISDTFTKEDTLHANSRLSVYLFGTIMLLACGWRVYSGLQSVMDIQFADEAAYMRFGLDLPQKLNRDWGPIYAIWYKCLSLFTTDTIQLYYLNFILTSIVVGALLYIFLLRIGVQTMFALLISYSVLVSDLNISVWPRISHFCLVLCLLSLILITYLKNNIYKCLVFTLLCLINSYARPEFYLSFLAMSLVTIICIIYNRSSLLKKDYLWFTAAVFTAAALHFFFRFPSNDFFGYNRGVAAFYQHYAWNYKWQTHADFDAWLYWEDLAKKQFGDCNSMWCVIKTQPLIVLKNTLFNIRNYIFSILTHIYTYIFPIGMLFGKKFQLLLHVSFLVVSIALLVQKKSRVYFFKKINQYKFYLLLLFCFIAPSVLSCIAVFPRDHYLYLQLLFVLILLISLFGYLFRNFNLPPIAYIVFGIFLLLATPSIKRYSFLQGNNEIGKFCNKSLITSLKDDYGMQPHTLFTNMPFVRGMLPTNFKEVNTIFDKKKNIPFSFYLDSAKIDIVIITLSLFRDPHIKSDSTWLSFMENYTDYGFKKKVIGDCEMYLLSKTDSENSK